LDDDGQIGLSFEYPWIWINTIIISPWLENKPSGVQKGFIAMKAGIAIFNISQILAHKLIVW
jgi:hypothetical protein